MASTSESEERWNTTLLHQYTAQISVMESELTGNARFLMVTNVLLLAGSGLLVIAAASEIAATVYRVPPIVIPAMAVGLGGGAVVIAQLLMRWRRN